MPLVRIEITAGHDAAYKRAVMDGIHKGLQTALDIPDWDRFQRLYELEPECFDRGPKSDRFTMITIDLFPGRTKEQKASVYADITAQLAQSPGIAPEDVFIVLQEPPNENWGLAGQQRRG